MTLHRSLTLALAVLATASCTDPTGTPDPDPARLSQLGAGPERVVGSGHVQDADGLREFTFHALGTRGGGVRGSYKVVLANGLFFEADVTCMAVEDDTGWVAGRIRATNAAPVVVGSLSWFFTVDGGEGSGAVDQVSLAAFNMPEGTDAEFCAERPRELDLMTVTGGNVQVR